MLKQKSSEYRGYRTAGVRLKEEMLPQLKDLYGSHTREMLPSVHAFDKAHIVMLVEENLMTRDCGAKLLQGNRGELKICNANGLVRNVLETSGFNSLIKVYDTEKEAFSAFAA